LVATVKQADTKYLPGSAINLIPSGTLPSKLFKNSSIPLLIVAESS